MASDSRGTIGELRWVPLYVLLVATDETRTWCSGQVILGVQVPHQIDFFVLAGTLRPMTLVLSLVGFLAMVHGANAPTDSPPTNMSTSLAQLAHMRAQVLGIRKAYEDARSQQDLVKLNFLNEKQQVAVGLLQVAEQSVVELEQALSRYDQPMAQHQTEKLQIIGDKLTQIARESAAAVGGLAVYTGDTQLDLQIDTPAGPAAAATPVEGFLAQSTPNVILTRPAAASPYL